MQYNGGWVTLSDVQPSGEYSLSGRAIEYGGRIGDATTSSVSGGSCLVHDFTFVYSAMCPFLQASPDNAGGHYDGLIYGTQASARQPVFVTGKSRWSVKESIGYTSSTIDTNRNPQNVVDEAYVPLQLATDYKHRYHLFGQAARFSVNARVRKGVLDSGKSLNGSGPPLFTRNGVTYADNQAEGNFLLGRLRLHDVQGMPAGFKADFRARGQYTQTRTPMTETFVLGGPDQLAAWLPGVAFGDAGASSRLTFKSPPMRWFGVDTEAGVFAEAGLAQRQAVPSDIVNTIGHGNYPTFAGSVQILGDYGLDLSFKAFKHGSLNLVSALPMYHKHVTHQIREAERAYFYFTLRVWY